MIKANSSIISPLKCIAHGELNGDLSLELSVRSDWCFVNADGIRQIENGDIITAPLPGLENEQMFRIYETNSSTSSYEIKYKARHIFYDLADNFVVDTRPTDVTPKQAVEKLLANTEYATEFTVDKIFDGAQNTAYWQYKSPIDALIGNEDNSFINRWGGELRRDNYKISFVKPDEQGNEVYVKYGHNLKELGLTTSLDDVVTRIMPTALGETQNEVIKLPEIYVNSEHIGEYPHPKIKRYHYSDIRKGSEGYETDELIFAELRKRAAEEFAKGIDLPTLSGKVSIVDLSQTIEYAGAEAYTINPYDSFIVIDREGNQYSTRLTSFDYDCLALRYTNLGFGDVNTLNNFQRLIKAVS